MGRGSPVQCFSFKCNLHDTGVKGTALTQREAIFKKIMSLRGNFFPGFFMPLTKRLEMQYTEQSPVSPKVLQCRQ